MEKNKKLDKIVGAAYEELGAEDMQQIQGAGDVDGCKVNTDLMCAASVKGAFQKQT